MSSVQGFSCSYVQPVESLPALERRVMSGFEHMAQAFIREAEFQQNKLTPHIQQLHERRARLQAALDRTEPYGDQSRTKVWLDSERERVGGLLNNSGDCELLHLDARAQNAQQAAIQAQVDAEVDALAVSEVRKQQKAINSTYQELVETNPEELMLVEPIPSYNKVQRRYAGYAHYAAKYAAGGATPTNAASSSQPPAAPVVSSSVPQQVGPIRDGARPSYRAAM
eukprot:RCo035688